MSRRPTTQIRVECRNSTNTLNSINVGNDAVGYTVIGDTVAATLYARRIINNGITAPIYIISEGVDKTDAICLHEVGFPATNIKRILQYLMVEQIHITDSGSIAESFAETAPFRDEVIHYHVGSGVLGDFIATYFSPRVGPYYAAPNNRLTNFVEANTIQRLNTPKEQSVVTFLQGAFGIRTGLPLTSSVTVQRPSILDRQYIFMNDIQGACTRNLFAAEKASNEGYTGTHYITGAMNIKFNTTSVANVYNITGTDVTGAPIDIRNTRVIWKTNPYTFLRLATNGGLNPSRVLIPTFYRARIPIPLTSLNSNSSARSSNSHCSCSDSHSLSTLDSCTADLVTSFVSFSLPDLSTPSSSSLSWLVQAYTTPEDLSVTDPSGVFAAADSTFLIVEATSLKNKRSATYDTTEQETNLLYNKLENEQSFLLQFATIVSKVYQAYTGTVLTPETLVMDSATCNSNGACQDADVIVDYSLRESPLSIVLQTLTLYDTDTFVNPGSACC